MANLESINRSVTAPNVKSPTQELAELKKQVAAQEELLQKIYQQTEKTRKYIFWGRIMSVIYLILILAPILAAVVYLPPLVKNILSPYQELLSGSSDSNLLDQLTNTQKNKNIDIEDLLKAYR